MATVNLIAEPGNHAIITSREFNAPPDLVFKAHTDPALIPLWWGPRNLTTTVDQMDVQMGGLWRTIVRGSEGDEYIFRGVYHQVVAPERLVYTYEWEAMAGHISLETLTFSDQEGKTLLTTTSVFQSVADRDGMLQSGMQEGNTESWERLDELLQRELQLH